jgi:hypothetical protein
VQGNAQSRSGGAAESFALAYSNSDSAVGIPREIANVLHRLPLPDRSAPAVAMSFAVDSMRVGAATTLVMAAWFPRSLTDSSSHPARLAWGTVAGPARIQARQSPRWIASGLIGSRVFDLYASWQTVIATGTGRIVASPASLKYAQMNRFPAIPTDTAIVTPAAVLVVRP